MNFYEMLSQHYDVIFPRGEKQTRFIESYMGEGTKILDIGAGLGSYAEYFAKKGHQVTAIDLDEDMVKGMKAKAEHHLAPFDVCQMDMLEIDQFEESSFDGLFCIGNTLAHLPNFDLVNDFFEKAYSILKPNGWIIIQLVNYDRVLQEKMTELPVIERPDHGLRFVRKYDLLSDKEVLFKGELYVQTKHKKDKYEAETELLALRSETVCDSARNVGFNALELYGNFEKGPYNLNSPALILVGRKVK